MLVEGTNRGMLAGGLDDALNRTDAATIIVRLLEISQDLPAGELAYCYDVRPSDSLSMDEAHLVVERAKNPKTLTPQQQANGAEPMLDQDELGADDIALVREAILRLPEDQRADLYRQLNAKVTFRNQLDNAGKYTLGDYMCNVTSIAMAFNQLG